MNSNVIEQNQVKAPPRPTGVNFQAPNQEDLIELIGNWEWLAIMAMVDGNDGQVDANLIAARLGMTKDRAADTLAAMMSHNILHKTEDGKLVNYTKSINLTEDIYPISDLLNSFLKVRSHINSKVNSRDAFSMSISQLSREAIHNGIPKIQEIFNEMEKESKGKADVNIYAFDFAFTKLTRARSELL